MTDGTMRLNWGCGLQRPVGWCNTDVAHHGDETRLIRVPPGGRLPWGDDTFDGAVAHHVLQMLDWNQIGPALAEVHRVMKPGAILRVTVPDLLGAFDAYDENNVDWFPIADATAMTIDGKFCAYLSQCGATRSVFTAPWLSILLDAVGFGGITAMDESEQEMTMGPGWLMDLDSRLDESLLIEAVA